MTKTEIQKTTLEWTRLYIELALLTQRSTDMYLQFLCVLNSDMLKSTATAFMTKREELIKKLGQEKKDGGWELPEFVNKTDENPKGEKNPKFEEYEKSMKKLQDKKLSFTMEPLEAALLKGQNPREYEDGFAQLGYEFGVFNFREIFTITDAYLASKIDKSEDPKKDETVS